MSTSLSSAADGVRTALLNASEEDRPFRHWRLASLLPPVLYRALRDRDVGEPPACDGSGRRETRNAARTFLGPRTRDAAAVTLVNAFQHPAVVETVSALTGADLQGCFLRIEYCQDVDGFWLEPHRDVPAKRITLLIYLSDSPGSEAWGTDLLDADGRLVCRPAARPNSGVMFRPSADSWHGFAPRPIVGVRRTLIVNYVAPEWRAREELAFPDQPVGG